MRKMKNSYSANIWNDEIQCYKLNFFGHQIVLGEGGQGVLEDDAGEEDGVKDGEAVQQVGTAP